MSDDGYFERAKVGRKAAEKAPAPPPKASVVSSAAITPRPKHDLEARARAFFHDLWQGLKRAPNDFWHDFKILPKTVQWLIIAAAVLVAAVILFLANPNWNWARGFASSFASARLHRPVHIDGNLRVHLFSLTPSATVGNLRIGQPDWGRDAKLTNNMAEVGMISARAELLPVFAGRIVLPRLQIDRPNVTLFQDAKGRANWDFSDGKDKGKPAKLPAIKNFIINDGKLTVTSLQRRLTFKGTINAQERAGAGRQAFSLTGDGSLNGKVFELNATGGPLLNVRTDRPYPFEMAVRAGNTRLTANGRVVRPFNLGQLEGSVTVTGNNMADLYYLTGLTLPNTPSYRVSAQVTRNDMIYNIDRINGRVGGSDLQGEMKVDTRNNGRPYLTGDLSSLVLDFEDLGAVFGASKANAPQGAELSVAPTAPQATNRLLPDAPLAVERLRGMDAKVRYRALSVRAVPNLPLREVSLGVDLDHGLLLINPIDLSFPQGRLQGTARIDARQAVQTNTVDMRLTGLRIQDFLPNIQNAKPLEGVVNARLQANGTGNSARKAAATANGELTVVIPGGRIRQSLAELMGVNATKGLFMYLSKDKKETDVRCAVAHFKVQDGIMRADRIVFDTSVVLVNGSGSINLRDESMKFVLKGKPKKFRLFRVNVPLVVGGHLSSPKFGIDPGPALFQGGLAAAFQTIIPFIGLNTAESANCAHLLSEARAEGTPVGTKPAAKKIIASPVKE